MKPTPGCGRPWWPHRGREGAGGLQIQGSNWQGPGRSSAGGDRRFGRREVGGGWRWVLSNAGGSRSLSLSERCVPLGPSDSVTSSHRPVHYFFGGVPLPSPPPAPGFKQESSQQRHLASPPTEPPIAAVSTTGCFRHLSIPDVASSAVSSSSPIPGCDWEPRVPTPQP